MKKLNDKMFVSTQIQPEDVASIAAKGVTMIVNNRPDGEEPGQPPASAIQAAAQAAGVEYRHVPVGTTGLTPDKVQAMRDALDNAGGKVLAFCKSGTRSAYLWALARAEAGDDAAEIKAAAAGAGYDLTPIAPYLRG